MYTVECSWFSQDANSRLRRELGQHDEISRLMVSSKDLDNVTHSELVQKFGEKILMKYNKTTIVWKKFKNGLTNVFFVCDPYSVIEHFNSDYETGICISSATEIVVVCVLNFCINVLLKKLLLAMKQLYLFFFFTKFKEVDFIWPYLGTFILWRDRFCMS